MCSHCEYSVMGVWGPSKVENNNVVINNISRVVEINLLDIIPTKKT